MRAWILIVVAVVGMLAMRAVGAEVVVDAGAYKDDAAAQKAWRPMGGTGQVQVAEVEGKRGLRMPCDFATSKAERASWDRAVGGVAGGVDMTNCAGLRFKYLCKDAGPISSLSIYFESGGGWYACHFAPGTATGWNTIEVRKEETGIEDKPAGWGKIKTIRISAWRGGDQSTEFYIADLELFGGGQQGVGGGVGVVRGEAAGDEQAAAAEYAQQMCGVLKELGVGYSLISDKDLTAERLKGMRILVLPHDPGMSDRAANAVADFVNSGGKVLAFYEIPGAVTKAGGIQVVRHVDQKFEGEFATIHGTDAPMAGWPGDVKQASWNIMEARAVEGQSHVAGEWLDKDGKDTGLAAIVVSERVIYMSHVLLSDGGAAKRQMLLAMLGQLEPGIVKEAVTAAVGRVGKIAGYENLAEAVEALAGPRTAGALVNAKAGRDLAERLLQEGKYFGAYSMAAEAQHAVLEAYCLAQTPVEGEQRAFWCHSAFGVRGMTWDEAIKKLSDNGINAIYVNMLWGGAAYYPSEVLPWATDGKDRGDQIALCLAACRKYGVQCHVWKVDWNMGWNSPPEFMTRMKKEGRTQVNFDGKANDQWLCPSNPENQLLEIDAMVEVAKKYPVDGIHFDYIRYPGPDGCFCAGCRERFEKVLGRKLENWPAVVRKDDQVQKAWLDFRRDNITKVVAAASAQARAVRPGIKISAAVFSNWPTDRDGVGQDWKLWCDKGYLDFVCPMDYTPFNGEFENLVRRQIEWAGKVPVYPGIGLSTWPGPERDTVKLIEQINLARKAGCKGFTVFEYNVQEAGEVVELLGKGATRKQ